MACQRLSRNVHPAFAPSTFLTPTNFVASVKAARRTSHLHEVRVWIRTLFSCSAEPVEIRSSKNPRVKEAKSLLQRRQREKRDLILLEGQRLISDAINAGIHIQQLFLTQEACQRNNAINSIQKQAVEQKALQFFVTDSIMQTITDTVTPQGILAICKRPSLKLPPKASLLLICDGVQDPGNLGTLLRSAAASGVDAVATTLGCTDVWGLKVLRAGMGAQFHIPTQTGMSWTELQSYATRNKLTLHVASGGGQSEAHWNVDWCEPSGLVIGSEAFGASEEAINACNERMVKIPMCANVESLNAGMAGTVILFEASRQRYHRQRNQ